MRQTIEIRDVGKRWDRGCGTVDVPFRPRRVDALGGDHQ